VGWQHDRASVNGCAVRAIGPLAPNSSDIGCFSHGGSLTFKKLEVPVVYRILKLLNKMFHQSRAARVLWVKEFDCEAITYSDTRWCAAYDLAAALTDIGLPNVMRWIIKVLAAGVSEKTSGKLVAIFRDQAANHNNHFFLEFAAFKDVGRFIYNFTYLLEGDGYEPTLKCYQMVSPLPPPPPRLCCVAHT
jgi:hypothetical protein